MSRAINVNASQSDIEATCQRLGIEVSVLERLVSGGTRVVLNNVRDTDAIAKAYKTRLLSGPVTRAATRLNRGLRGETPADRGR
jgi:hypothetical protein